MVSSVVNFSYLHQDLFRFGEDPDTFCEQVTDTLCSALNQGCVVQSFTIQEEKWCDDPLKMLIFLMYMGVLSACMPVYHKYAYCLEDVRSRDWHSRHL